MAVEKLSDDRYVGSSTDIKPTAGVLTGAVFYEADTRKKFTFDGTTWVAEVSPISSAYDIRRSFLVMDEFLEQEVTSGGIGELDWTTSNTGGTGATVALVGTADHPGIIRISTFAAIDAARAMRLSDSSAIRPLSGINGRKWKIVYVARINTLTASKYRIGMTPGSSGDDPPIDGYYFERITGNWIAVTRTGGVETATDTGAAADTLFHSFEMISDASSVKFHLDGVLVATHAANLSGAELTPIVYLKTTDALSKSVDVDAFSFQYELSR